MVSETSELLVALDKLILSLKSTGKTGPAEFFAKKSIELQAGGHCRCCDSRAFDLYRNCTVR